jgi:CMP-N-acetylneuraminic acid synthetase
MEALGVVPARGGSKGIPGKNLVEVGGRSLLEWACRSGLESDRVSRVVVSTDDEAIADAARRLGADVLPRPVELAGDDVPMLPVLAHALDASGEADAVVLLQPTSPLRTARHVDEAVQLLLDTGADSVVSVVRVPHSFVPSSLLRQEGDRLLPYAQGGAMRRQEKELLFARNGPAVVATRAEVIRSGLLYGADSRAYEMSTEDSVDVDEAFDLEHAAWLLERRERS